MTRGSTHKGTARLALSAVVVLLVALGASMLLWQAGAVAQVDPYATQPPTVIPTIITNTPTPPETVQPTRITTPPPREPEPEPDDTPLGERQSNLPFTGADLTLYVGTGLAAIATGMVLVRRTRARRAGQQD